VAAPGPPRHHLDHQCRTGAIYLAAAGMLDGQDATTHWAWAGELERRGARYTGQRVVETGKVITAAGVSAGIDMALTLLARLHGRKSPRVSSWPSSTTRSPPSIRVHRLRRQPRWWSSCGLS
jgi:DJ-1/PfpI family